MSYNSNTKQAVLVEFRFAKPNQTIFPYNLESIRIYDLNSSSNTFIGGSVSTTIGVKYEERTIKAIQTSAIAIFTLTVHKRLKVL